MNSVIEALGVLGAVLLLVAYWLVSSNRMPSNAQQSHFLNFAGASLIALNSGYHGASPVHHRLFTTALSSAGTSRSATS